MANLSMGKITAQAKAAMIADLQLELETRKKKLRTQCEAQCASLHSRLERRVNRISPVKRQTLVKDILSIGKDPSKSVIQR
ncbi:hypothetical protein J1614_009451 [Plenodomus biglobosus]|nr:hypothetical protein J1614_009451 [Plenodomus biglobosus]